jgi:hypothetical protein
MVEDSWAKVETEKRSAVESNTGRAERNKEILDE